MFPNLARVVDCMTQTVGQSAESRIGINFPPRCFGLRRQRTAIESSVGEQLGRKSTELQWTARRSTRRPVDRAAWLTVAPPGQNRRSARFLHPSGGIETTMLAM